MNALVARLRQLGRITLAAVAFIGFGLGSTLLAWLVLPTLSLWGPQDARWRRCQRVVQGAFRLFHGYMHVTGLVTFNAWAQPAPIPDTAAVIVANHPTLVDVSAVIARYGPMCVVAKASLFRNPLVGPLLRCCGHIRGDAKATEEGVAVIVEGVARLRAGHRVLMFPEGTRSPPEGMRRWRNGAFHLAVQAGVDVQPICISADPPGLKKGDPWYRIPPRAIHLTLHPLARLPSSATMPDHNSASRALNAAARARVLEAMTDPADPRASRP